MKPTRPNTKRQRKVKEDGKETERKRGEERAMDQQAYAILKN